MNMHKNTRLTPHHREAIWTAYTQEKESVTSLARRYMVSRPTIYRILKAARVKLLVPQNSVNNRFKQAYYGMRRLAKVERSIQEKLKKKAKRYNKSICRNQQRCLHFSDFGCRQIWQVLQVVKNAERHGEAAWFLIICESC